MNLFKRGDTTRDPFDLDNPLIQFTKSDQWTIRDACEGTQIFGAIGSGKTSGSGATIAKSFLASGFGGLVMCAKPEERTLWESYTAETGRSEDLIVFAPDGEYKFNFLDYELRRANRGGGMTENIVNLISRIVEIAEGKQDQKGGDQFFERAMRQLIRNAVDLLRIAQGKLSLEDIVQVTSSAPQNPQEIGDKNWQERSFCAQLIATATDKSETLSASDQHDLDIATQYWLGDFANLADRTRTSIVATFTSVADILLHGDAYQLFCTDINIIPEFTFKNGKIIVLDLPIQEYHELGRIGQGIWKYMFQRSILARNVRKDPRPVFLWADEAQNFVSSFDFQYQAVARSARACTVYMTQNINNYYSVLGARSEHETHALLGNFQTKIFHANSDHHTNKYASDTISEELTTSTTWGINISDESTSQSGGGSEVVRHKVQPSTFTVLKKGGTPNKGQVEAIIFQGGRIWNATRDTYMKTVFQQS